MATAALLGLGTLLKIGDGGGPETFATIGEITSLDWSGRSRPALDATSHDSSAREFIAGVLDNGEVSGEYSYVPDDTEQEAVETDFLAGTLRNFEIILPDTGAKKFSFAAIITDLGTAMPVDDRLVRSFRLRISGAVTVS